MLKLELAKRKRTFMPRCTIDFDAKPGSGPFDQKGGAGEFMSLPRHFDAKPQTVLSTCERVPPSCLHRGSV